MLIQNVTGSKFLRSIFTIINPRLHSPAALYVQTAEVCADVAAV